MADQMPSIFSIVCAITGFLLVVGGIVLLWKEKIHLEKESAQPTVLKLPFGSLSTNQSAVFLFVLGLVAVVYPVYCENQIRNKVIERGPGKFIDIKGSVESDEIPVIVYAIMAEQTMLGEKRFELSVPARLPGQPPYSLLVQAGPMIDKRPFEGSKSDSTDPFHFLKPTGTGGSATNEAFESDTIGVPADFQGRN
jgi:hypothetical protein